MSPRLLPPHSSLKNQPEDLRRPYEAACSPRVLYVQTDTRVWAVCPRVPLFRGHGTEAMCTQAVLRGEVTRQWKVGQRTLWPQPQENAVFSGFLCDLLIMSLAIHSFTHFEYLKTGHNDTYSLEQ